MPKQVNKAVELIDLEKLDKFKKQLEELKNSYDARTKAGKLYSGLFSFAKAGYSSAQKASALETVIKAYENSKVTISAETVTTLLSGSTASVFEENRLLWPVALTNADKALTQARASESLHSARM